MQTDSIEDHKSDSNPQSKDEFLFAARLIPMGREGNRVFARTLRLGEEDAGETIKLEPGDQLVIPAGGLVVNSREIDAYSIKGLGGYAPVANTVWTWYRIVGVQLGFYLLLFSLARRLDAAHALWALAIQERDKAREEDGIPHRASSFNALARAEVAIIALHRGLTMMHSLIEGFCPRLDLPESVKSIQGAVKEMRDAFEHIDDRAAARSGQRRKVDLDALTIFDQPDFVDSSILHYKSFSINFHDDVISTLFDCREWVMEAIDAEAALREEGRGVEPE